MTSSKHQCWSILLYQEHIDNNILNNIIDYINNINGLYAYICHDKCYYTETTFDELGNLKGGIGELKKKHWHVFIKLPYGVYNSDIKAHTGLEFRFIKPFKPSKLEEKILYLTHINTINKVIYNINDIVTNKNEYIKYIYECYNHNEIHNNIITVLFNYIKNHKSISYLNFLQECLNNNIELKDIKKYWCICKDIIYENHFNKKDIIDDNRFKDKISKLESIFNNLNIDDNGLKEIYEVLEIDFYNLGINDNKKRR